MVVEIEQDAAGVPARSCRGTPRSSPPSRCLSVVALGRLSSGPDRRGRALTFTKLSNNRPTVIFGKAGSALSAFSGCCRLDRARRNQQGAIADHLGFIRAAPGPGRADLPDARRFAAPEILSRCRPPPAAISRHPRSAGRRQTRHAPAYPPPLANRAKSPYELPPHGGCEDLVFSGLIRSFSNQPLHETNSLYRSRRPF